MITYKQFDAYVNHIRQLQFDGHDVYIHGKKVVRTQLSTDDQLEYRFEKQTKSGLNHLDRRNTSSIRRHHSTTTPSCLVCTM